MHDIIVKNMAAYLGEVGYTYAALAKLCGMDEARLVRILEVDLEADEAELVMIARALGKSLEFFWAYDRSVAAEIRRADVKHPEPARVYAALKIYDALTSVGGAAASKRSSFFEYEPLELKVNVFHVKRMLPEYVYDTVQLEGNPFDFAEVKTLLDGCTVGGRRVSDEQQILLLIDGWRRLLDAVSTGQFEVSLEFMDMLCSTVCKDVDSDRRALGSAFKTEILTILNDQKSVLDRGIDLYLWIVFNRFYHDCSRRMGLLLANGILISNGMGALSIPKCHQKEYFQLEADFFNIQEADKIVAFIRGKCIQTLRY